MVFFSKITCSIISTRSFSFATSKAFNNLSLKKPKQFAVLISNSSLLTRCIVSVISKTTSFGSAICKAGKGLAIVKALACPPLCLASRFSSSMCITIVRPAHSISIALLAVWFYKLTLHILFKNTTPKTLFLWFVCRLFFF